MDAETRLWSGAQTRMFGENSFYQNASDWDLEFIDLVEQVSQDNPEWMKMFIPWLRSVIGIRTAAIVAATHYVKVGGHEPRKVVAGALGRADEPGEMIGYWQSISDKPIPSSMKRGISDACQRLYTQRAVLKWDTSSHPWRFADVIAMCHCSPTNEEQAALYKYCLDGRGHDDADDKMDPEVLWLISNTRKIDAIDKPERRDWLKTAAKAKEGNPFKGSGYTWERMSGWLPANDKGDVLDAEAWEAIVPSMYLFAIIRNLRNIEQAGIGAKTKAIIREKLNDPEEVAAARLMPLDIYKAYEASQSRAFADDLQQALFHSVNNIPVFDDRTIVFVDGSASMNAPVAGKPRAYKRRGQQMAPAAIHRSAAASVFGAAIAHRNPDNTNLIRFGDFATMLSGLGNDLLHTVQLLQGQHVGHGTQLWPAVHEIMNRFDDIGRIICLTDEQVMGDSGWGRNRWSGAPANLGQDWPFYSFNLASYGTSMVDTSKPGVHLLSGLTDNAFKMIPRLETRRSLDWEDVFALGQ